MKQYKLKVHQKDFSVEDLVLNPKEFPQVHVGDVMEIYHPEEKFCRLLLQVNSLVDEIVPRDTISVEQSIASTFQLRSINADVFVNIVDPKTTALDSVELTFKDQYLERGDMWRLKKYLEGGCVYLNKKVEYLGIRCQVYEMWAQGDKVACGVITEDTKVVFRSSTSLVYLFIQMSSEMWDVDINGDLYFEKTINGFLSDLFWKWKKNVCSHEVTIVFFSRNFYDAQSIDEFPEYMHECLQQDYRARFFEDFYHVAAQNERYDDWTIILVHLKKLFNCYRESVLDYHKRPGVHIPKAVNSTAAQGNFLEVLNMSLNVFEKHYMDRSFDRTGHLSVVITPGVGVFEVDRELTNITKQRIIDNGVGSDLVCLGEQPLHAVPLFKFHNKNIHNTADDYSMPHWINLSFYSTGKQTAYSSFVPRIKLPPKKVKVAKGKHRNNNDLIHPRPKVSQHEDLPALTDYDAYDSHVFRHALTSTNNLRNTWSPMRKQQRKKSELTAYAPRQVAPRRKLSETELNSFVPETPQVAARSAAINIPSASLKDSPQSSSVTVFSPDGKITSIGGKGSWDDDNSPPPRTIVGSAGSPFLFHGPGRALINPFDPSHVTIKLTSNRRRWTHVFPIGPTGVFMQQHHYQGIQRLDENDEFPQPYVDTIPATTVQSVENRKPFKPTTLPGAGMSIAESMAGRFRSTPSRSNIHTPDIPSEKSLALIWGATGEQHWTPALTTGVDWKSLQIPACLPLTTDYFPDKRSIQNDYVISDYTLLPDDVNADLCLMDRSQTPLLTTPQVFQELVCQRLQQGFQLIVTPKASGSFIGSLTSTRGQSVNSPQFSRSFSRSHCVNDADRMQEYLLSIGRIFHKISLVGSNITATCLRPRHPYPTIKIHYRYRFKAPDNDNYEISCVDFACEKLENFNWNHLDHYICSRGEGDFALTENLKHMRYRMFLLANINPETKKILEVGDQTRCDLFSEFGPEDNAQMVDGFIKFLDGIHRIRRPAPAPKIKRSGTFSGGRGLGCVRRGSQSFSANPIGGPAAMMPLAGPFRERVGSNRFPERPRPRTGSKVMERMRSESGNGGRGGSSASCATGDINDSKMISSSSLSLDTGTDSLSSFQSNADYVGDDSVPCMDVCRLGANCPLTEIIEAMKQPQDGMSFIVKTPGLPQFSFVSAEAVSWLMDRMEGVFEESAAISLLEMMLEGNLICHASGVSGQNFVYGYYLYYIVPSEKELKNDPEMYDVYGDVERFSSHWMEVAFVIPERGTLSAFTNLDFPNFLQPDQSWASNNNNNHSQMEELETDVRHFQTEMQTRKPSPRQETVYKTANIPIAVSTKSDREEWGHVKYHAKYVVGGAYEISLHWVVATGSIITELASGWYRKAISNGFSLVTVPSDPFALPDSYKSDPLRGPIFVPLNTQCLHSGRSYLFSDFSETMRDYRLFLLQETIAKKFGFVPIHYDQMQQGSGHSTLQYPQYIHLTGNMFLMILTRVVQQPSAGKQDRNKHLQNMVAISSPRDDYLTRNVNLSSAYKREMRNKKEDNRLGFLWSWNYMLSKRSKAGIVGDEQFMNKALKDFQMFCSNSEDRLKTFWDSCYEQGSDSDHAIG